ncbi:MAG: Fic family protein [Actinobacteria bacterium]|nr:Fic family protein [Actinomycetota bacterium]
MTGEPHQVDYLSVDDLLEIGAAVTTHPTVRDAGLLASAAARPRASVFGTDAYPSFAEKAAALLHSLARNDALVDGNKRLAWAATRVFCLLNGRDLVLAVDDAEAMVLAVAAGRLDVPDLAALLDQHIGPDPA